MNILKLALLGSLRIAFFGFLKVALSAYTLFLPDTAFAGAAREDNGQVGDTASYGAPKGNSNANMASAGRNASGGPRQTMIASR
jgi:hypothetical protein